MTLGLFLAIGESLGDFNSKGQLKRLTGYNIKKYSESFGKVYIFSYADEYFELPQNCQLVVNKYHLHRYLYAFLMPIIHYRQVKDCNILRGLQITGGIPALVSKILYGKKFTINYGYDYSQFALLEGKPIQSLFYKIIKTPILFLADSIIVPSKTIAGRLREKFPKKIVYIPNGVDAKLFYPLKTKTDKRSIDIVFVGRLEKQKNLESLIKAARDLKINYNLTFYGEGSKLEELLKLAKNLNVPLQIKKPVAYKEVPKILRSCDIFVLPSYKEGSPKILLEAMASGCAIVASGIPQITEIITDGETGVLTGQTPQELANVIGKLRDFKTRQKLGQNARKTVIEKYEINKLLAKEITILINLAK
ncbi:MAG: glycosyltransferase family 4 protein [Candidatus Curtissbacteria bacterium]|nr:glycosyltransferase family 4 protein [Candidatus Curtissbacteria bacterium]